jgi:hypothetical protein
MRALLLKTAAATSSMRPEKEARKPERKELKSFSSIATTTCTVIESRKIFEMFTPDRSDVQ